MTWDMLILLFLLRHGDLGDMSMLLGVTGVSGCHRIKFFSYKLETEDRKTDFELRRVYSGFDGKET